MCRVCSEEQKAEAEGLPKPYSDWELSDVIYHEEEWGTGHNTYCHTVGEYCTDGYHYCVERFDQHDITGQSFMTGGFCYRENEKED